MEHQITLHYRTYENWRENSVIPKEIAERLEALLNTAYAPYSNYPVSSVVVMESGCNDCRYESGKCRLPFRSYVPNVWRY